MSEVPTQKMTVDEFLVWAERQPGRHELVDGRVLAMAPERARHADAKFAVQTALHGCIKFAGLSCFMLPDGMTVRVDRSTSFEPDALVYCGERLSADAIEVPDPLIVVEVLSPSTRGYDTGAKLAGYFRVPSVRHYLVVDADHRLVTHHARGGGEAITARVVGFGTLSLDPPGIDVAVEDLFGGPPASA